MWLAKVIDILGLEITVFNHFFEGMDPCPVPFISDHTNPFWPRTLLFDVLSYCDHAFTQPRVEGT
jgi:hypothetical protein